MPVIFTIGSISVLYTQVVLEGYVYELVYVSRPKFSNVNRRLKNEDQSDELRILLTCSYQIDRHWPDVTSNTTSDANSGNITNERTSGL